jgi:hypothetical protein
MGAVLVFLLALRLGKMLAFELELMLDYKKVVWLVYELD